jgi:hypothetical protein
MTMRRWMPAAIAVGAVCLRRARRGPIGAGPGVPRRPARAEILRRRPRLPRRGRRQPQRAGQLQGNDSSTRKGVTLIEGARGVRDTAQKGEGSSTRGKRHAPAVHPAAARTTCWRLPPAARWVTSWSSGRGSAWSAPAGRRPDAEKAALAPRRPAACTTQASQTFRRPRRGAAREAQVVSRRARSAARRQARRGARPLPRRLPPGPAPGCRLARRNGRHDGAGFPGVDRHAHERGRLSTRRSTRTIAPGSPACTPACTRGAACRSSASTRKRSPSLASCFQQRRQPRCLSHAADQGAWPWPSSPGWPKEQYAEVIARAQPLVDSARPAEQRLDEMMAPAAGAGPGEQGPRRRAQEEEPSRPADPQAAAGRPRLR